MKKIYGIIVLILIVILVGRYFSGENINSDDKPIMIGATLSLTGPAAQFGEYSLKGIQLAVKEINEKGGIDGRQVKMVYEDDQTDPKRAVLAFNKLVGVDKVEGIIGGLWDFVAQPQLSLALNSEIVFITPTQFRIENGFELNEQSFTMLTDFNQVIKKLTVVLSKESVKKVAVVHFKSVFGNEISKTINQITKEINKGDIIDESYSAINANDFKTTILKLKSQKVDTVFIDMVDNDTVNFLKRAKELGLAAQIITYTGSHDALKNEDVPLLNNVIILNWDVASVEFSKKFLAEYGIMPAKGANRAYDSVYILAEAISKAKDKSEVAAYISSHSFKTVNGETKFLSTHQVGSIPVEVSMFVDGELVPVKN